MPEGLAMKIGTIRNMLACAALWLAIGGLGSEALAAPNCVCRYAGKNYALGQCVGMNNAAGIRCGCCGRVLNNTSWTFTAGACGIVSRKSTPRPSAETTPARTSEREIAAFLALH